jgi:hypothetical protein
LPTPIHKPLQINSLSTCYHATIATISKPPRPHAAPATIHQMVHNGAKQCTFANPLLHTSSPSISPPHPYPAPLPPSPRLRYHIRFPFSGVPNRWFKAMGRRFCVEVGEIISNSGHAHF